ncbi:SNF2-related protein [Acaryochloris sp. CCMEE 5410]|uniref:SNF2-related protein n=1 Tax=Acaryochloris sp. CCMEE 5410 TaxID=310037 RepID=UPI0002484199|nr:SNF2-related protein [Acaryochloris sp. CCMEE 5410]KAI9130055.1 DEAD/DEAH box helicase family protein [Acaryochloris sp. CCMEE 5410]
MFDVQIRGGLDDELGIAQAKLNQVYDQFVAKNGNLSDSGNKRVFNLDPDAQLILALEQKNKNTEAIEKTAVFSRRTVRPKEVRASAETSQEALVTSLNEYNQVVPGYMAQLVGEDEAVVLADLQQQGLIFKEPTTGQWQTEDQYLSGGVREKLKIAQAAVEGGNPEFQANVEALQKVQPRDLGPGEIEVRLGSPWIPPETIADFAHDLLQVPKESGGITVNHSSNFAVWNIKAKPSIQSNSHNLKTYGTGYYSAIELIEKSLNLKDVSVFYKDADGKSRVDQQATMSVRMKQEQIKERFKGWIWKDFDRSQTLCKIYNDLFNGTVIREFRNPNLEMPGSSPSITLRPHQKDAVWRSLQSPTTLLAHEVGAGKTFTMVASAIEMRRLGIAKKPMIVVPNHMLEQFTNEFQQLYPNAKVLAPGEKDTKASKRKELMARIATGDWDAVIVTHSAFKLLPISKEQEKDFYVQQLTEVESVINEQGDRKGNAIVKQLARERRKLQERIEAITKSEKRDDGVLFDQLGVDALFVDEAHFWKNLGRPSKLENITGLSNTNSQRAMDGFMKCQLIRKQGGRLVFATGTPISNSIAEMYTMQRFLQPEALERQGIGNFDAWVGAFAEKVTAPEIDATGRFKIKTRLAKFTNVPELMTLFRETADIKTTAQLQLPVPEVERITVTTQASQVQLSYMERLISRAEAVASRRVRPTQDNMLLITTDGRRSSLDMRLVSPDIPNHPQSKASQAVTNIHKIWESTAENRLTQMVFCDLGTPKKAKDGGEGRFSLYADIKAGLMAKGIPAEEIAFIHDAANNQQKEELYGKMRKGDVRVLIGSSEKCAVGMNIQDRLIAEHHLDAPWRPSDIAQREGRIIRQGNRNSKVIVMTYVTQGRNGQLGFDSYSWQTLARKAEMVGQVMNGDPTLRSVDDISGAALSFDEIKAIATGNPLIMEKASVDNRVTELQRYEQAFLNERYDNQREIKDLIPERIKNVTQRINALTSDIAIRQDTSGDKFKIKIGNKTLDKRQDAGQLLLNIMGTINKKDKKGEQKIGEFAGFDLMAFILDRYKTALNLRSPNGNSYYISGGESPLGIIRSMESCLSKLPENLEGEKKSLARINSELSVLEEGLDKPFEYETELEQQLSRQHEINTELGIYKSDEQSITAEEDESAEVEPDKAQTEGEQDPGKNDQLIDLDDLDSLDANLDWFDGVDEEEVYAPSEPTPELTAALQNLGTFAPDPKQETAELEPSVEPEPDLIEAPQAQAPDSPVEEASTPEIPESIIEGLKGAISEIESFNEAIEAGRYLDQTQGGQGRYEFESFENRSPSIHQAQETISQFRAMCPEKGVDAEQVLNDLGYVPPLEISEQAQEWIKEPDEAPEVKVTPVVQGEDEQMSLLIDSPQHEEEIASEIENDEQLAMDQKPEETNAPEPSQAQEKPESEVEQVTQNMG